MNKNGANPIGDTNFVQASQNGERLVYLAPAGMPGGAGEGQYPSFLSERTGGAWETEGLLPSSAPGASLGILGWSEDLAVAALSVSGENAPADEGLQLRSTTTGSFSQAVPAGFGYHLAAVSADHTRLTFESTAPLLPNAAPGVDNLYEWSANAAPGSHLTLAGVLPSGETPAGGSFAGSYNWARQPANGGGAEEGLYTQDTLSTDGSTVIFTTGESGEATANQIFLRKNGASTVQASASVRTEPDPNGVKPAAFMAATPDASRVFFTTCQKLTNDSTAVSTPAPECTTAEQGQDLYEFDTTHGSLSDLTNTAVSDPETASLTHGAAVQGVLGTSEDGSYVYFAANGVLARGAKPGTCLGIHFQSVGSCNLYVWHDGQITFIAPLNASAEQEVASDSGDWRPGPHLVETSAEKTARVSADGTVLLFRSSEQLTPYNNRRADGRGCNHLERPGGDPCAELYRYDAAAPQIACVSCNPSGAPPTGPASLQSIHVLATAPASPASLLTRNLSADGRRVIFESPDPLAREDTNGVQDVYEWEADGTGSCELAAGCVHLLSSGQSPEPSFFADASENGNDAFLFTAQQLVGQDEDANVDVYDARVDGGLASQNQLPAIPCDAEVCKPASSAPGGFGVPASSAVSGEGNLAPVAPPRLTGPPALTRAQQLAAALRACRRKHDRHLRRACEARARKRYGTARRSVRGTRGKR